MSARQALRPSHRERATPSAEFGLVERAVGLGAGSFFGTRPPYQSEVVPSSPLRV